ncbi:cytochrome P450 6AQ1 [Osmia lignaria lignaria]|uniref:cytochrome P450 6AQ1 n=1 Tax=Osmia lignaria lignaria TaxID=1437193 RepID=UPI00402B4ABC
MALITQYWGLDGLIVFSALMVYIYFLISRNFKYWEKRGVMEVPRTLLLGNFGDCLLGKRAPCEFLQDLYNQSKGLPYMGFYIFNKPYFLARDPELIKHIMVKDFNVFGDRHSTADGVHDRLGYANLFMMKNPAWKVLRTKLTPIFTSGKLKKMFDLMLLIAKDLENCLQSMDLEGDGKVIELKDLCANFTTDMIGSTAFGLKVSSLEKPDTLFRDHGRQIFSYSLKRSLEFIIIFFLPEYVKYTRPKLFGKSTNEFLRNVFWDVINERVKSQEKRNDLIDLLIELKKKHENDTDLTDFKFDGDDLVAQAIIFFTGGFETSSTTMSFTLYELAVDQEVQKTLRKEIHNALEQSGGKITYDMIMTLPYLDMVISETLRKYPPLAFLDRVTSANYKVPNSDLVLPKGTPVYIPMMGIHRDPEYYPDPDKYDPSRFTEENKQKRPNFTYFPFGEGPHVCIGLRLGLMQSKLGVVQLIKDYEVTVCDKTTIPMTLNPRGLTTTAEHGIYVNCRKLTTVAG